MSATLVASNLRISAPVRMVASPSVQAIREMPIEALRAELKARRERSAATRESEQVARITADAESTVELLSEPAA